MRTGAARERRPRGGTGILVVRGLVKRIGGRVVLGGIDARADPGEVVTLVGPSGSGKSTLLACVAGLEPFDEGEVRIGEVSLAGASRARRREVLERDIGILFQNYGLVEEWTVEENLGVVRRLRRRSRLERSEAMVEALERFGLDEGVLDTRAATLSGGEQQRVALALLRLQSPRLVLADEPSSALDDDNCARLLDFFDEHARGGGAVLVATHDARIVGPYGTGLRLVADGTLAEVS
ncbi:MAG: ATP-binding cassette domain-containing protein [Pseudoclavibacter sp.]|nr:ATP-binding cassette domain-containing protein [Pseudoclavibacter sp.]